MNCFHDFLQIFSIEFRQNFLDNLWNSDKKSDFSRNTWSSHKCLLPFFLISFPRFLGDRESIKLVRTLRRATARPPGVAGSRKQCPTSTLPSLALILFSSNVSFFKCDPAAFSCHFRFDLFFFTILSWWSRLNKVSAQIAMKIAIFENNETFSNKTFCDFS